MKPLKLPPLTPRQLWYAKAGAFLLGCVGLGASVFSVPLSLTLVALAGLVLVVVAPGSPFVQLPPAPPPPVEPLPSLRADLDASVSRKRVI